MKVTNANVCASIVPARSRFASAKGMARAERKSCGRKASDSKLGFVEVKVFWRAE